MPEAAFAEPHREVMGGTAREPTQWACLCFPGWWLLSPERQTTQDGVSKMLLGKCGEGRGWLLEISFGPFPFLQQGALSGIWSRHRIPRGDTEPMRREETGPGCASLWIPKHGFLTISGKKLAASPDLTLNWPSGHQFPRHSTLGHRRHWCPTNPIVNTVI